MVQGNARFEARERLKTGAQYQRVFKRGTRVDGRLFVLVALDNGLTFFRLGLAVGRRVGSAVVRNRAKRLLREAFRRQKDRWSDNHDLILVAKAALADRTLAEVDRELDWGMRQLAKRRGHKPAGPPAAAGH